MRVKYLHDELFSLLQVQVNMLQIYNYKIYPQNMTEFHLDSEWRVMSVNRDWNGFEFISSIEHRDYPFYGVQFHPEKNLYEWVRNKNISHTSSAIKASQYFAQFFVSEARRSTNSFRDAKTEDQFVIYNFNVTFTGAVGSAFEQCYLFPADIDYPRAERVPVQVGISNQRPGERSTCDNFLRVEFRLNSCVVNFILSHFQRDMQTMRAM